MGGTIDLANQIIIVLVADGLAVNETSYGQLKTALQTQIDNFNNAHPNFQLAIDSNRSRLVEAG